MGQGLKFAVQSRKHRPETGKDTGPNLSFVAMRQKGPCLRGGVQKSVAVEVTLQPTEKSYAEADLKAIADAITAAAGKLGAVLRG